MLVCNNRTILTNKRTLNYSLEVFKARGPNKNALYQIKRRKIFLVYFYKNNFPNTKLDFHSRNCKPFAVRSDLFKESPELSKITCASRWIVQWRKFKNERKYRTKEDGKGSAFYSFLSFYCLLLI